MTKKASTPAPTWRVLKADVAGHGKGDVVPAEELIPQIGAMHERGLIEPVIEPPAPADGEHPTTHLGDADLPDAPAAP